MTEVAAAQEQGTNTLTGLLAAIAVVSLVVGGIRHCFQVGERAKR